ncbi:MAG: penicillin-binding protein 2, partial [Propionicimonas sp.]
MNGPIRRVAVTVMVLFAALVLNLSYSYIARQSDLLDQPKNRRVTDARFAQDRGPILAGKTRIAETTAVKDQYKFQRSYGSGELYAPVTGFYSYFYGASALEKSYSAQLSGADDSQFLNRLVNLATGATPRGGTVETTLDGRAQQAAWNALAGRKGAVVALDTKTGAVRA